MSDDGFVDDDEDYQYEEDDEGDEGYQYQEEEEEEEGGGGGCDMKQAAAGSGAAGQSEGRADQLGRRTRRVTDALRFFPSHMHSATVQKMLQTMQVPEGKAVIADVWDYLPRINSLTNDLSGCLSVNYDVALQLLLYFKFDRQRLEERYFDEDPSLVLLGLRPKTAGAAASSEAPQHYALEDVDCGSYTAKLPRSQTCSVCYDDFDLTDGQAGATPTGFCCCCHHVFCAECYMQFVCNKIYTEGISCLVCSNMSNCSVGTGKAAGGGAVLPPPLFTCPYYQCNILLPFSLLARLLCDNQTPVSITTGGESFLDGFEDGDSTTGASASAASASTPAAVEKKKLPAAPTVVTRPAHFYFVKYVELLAKYYVSCCRAKLSLPTPSGAYRIGDTVATSTSESAAVADSIAGFVWSVQYCPSSSCGGIAVIGKLPPPGACGSGVAALPSVFGGASSAGANPVVPLQLSTNVRCSRCSASFCLVCGQGGNTRLQSTAEDGSSKEVLVKQPHMPASCRQYALWCAKNASGDSETANWLLLNTKQCPGPKCQGASGAVTRIEKNSGCNHMTCKVCGWEFCWICMGSWKEHGGSYYKCNRYVEKDDKGVNSGDKLSSVEKERQAKRELDRYLHYYNRFQGHELAAKYASTVQRAFVASKVAQLQSTGGTSTNTTPAEGVSPTRTTPVVTSVSVQSTPAPSSVVELLHFDDGSFMEAAVEQVVRCRTVLKYSYVLGFYLCSDIANHDELAQQQEKQKQKLSMGKQAPMSLATLNSAKNLFEHQQEMLEKNTEVLSELTEDYCKRGFGMSSGGIKGKSASMADSTAESLVAEKEALLETRNHIINLTKITEKFMTHLLESIGDGDAAQLLVTGDAPGGAAPAIRSDSETEVYEMIMQQQLLDRSSAKGLASSSGTNASASASVGTSGGAATTKENAGIMNALWSSFSGGKSSKSGSGGSGAK